MTLLAAIDHLEIISTWMETEFRNGLALALRKSPKGIYMTNIIVMILK